MLTGTSPPAGASIPWWGGLWDWVPNTLQAAHCQWQQDRRTPFRRGQARDLPESKRRLVGTEKSQGSGKEKARQYLWRANQAQIFLFREVFCRGTQKQAMAVPDKRSRPIPLQKDGVRGGAEPPQRRAADQSPAADTSVHAHPSPRPQNETQTRLGRED